MRVSIQASLEGQARDNFHFFVEANLGENPYTSLVNVRRKLAASQEFAKVELCICIAKDGLVYGLCGHGGSLSLVRDGQTYALLKTENNLSLISGAFRKGDEYILKAGSESRFLVDDKETLEKVATRGLRRRLIERIDSVLLKLPERRIIVHGEETERNSKARKAAIAGVIFLAVLGVSIFFGLSQRNKAILKREYEPVLVQAIHDYNEAIELSSLSKSRARDLIIGSREAAKGLHDRGVKDQRLSQLLLDIAAHLPEIAGIYEAPASLFFDLTIVSSGFRGGSIALSGGLVRVLDKESKKLVGIEVSNKRTSVISGPDYLPDAKQVAAYANRSFILSSDGVREVTEEVELVVKPEWDADEVLLAVFAGNIYILDRGNNQIWRYQGTAGGFSERQEWMGKGLNFSLENAESISIDGAIWTNTKDNEIRVYSRGIPVAFNISGQTGDFVDIAALFVEEESGFVYILDKGTERISVIGKNGNYIGEYMAPELSEAHGLVVDEKSGLMLFLAGSRVYSIEAKHLNSENENS